MEVLGFITRGSCNYGTGSDTVTHNKKQNFLGCCKYCTVMRTQQAWDSIPGRASTKRFGQCSGSDFGPFGRIRICLKRPS
jgi:hypothetical protein